MKITNELNLPDPIVQAVTNDPYDPGTSDITVTQVIDSPQIPALIRQYHETLAEDASHRIWSLFGQSIHTILERADTPELRKTGAKVMTENRFYANVVIKGRTIELGGKIDRAIWFPRSDADPFATLQDYKTASTWEYIYGLKADRIAQLNVYAYLMELADHPVDRVQAVMLFKDWSPGQIPRNDAYPRRPVHVFDVKRWTNEETATYIKERLERHFIEPAYCTPEERWEQKGKYRVLKEGRKTALRVLDSRAEAYRWCLDRGHASGSEDGSFELNKGISIVRTEDEQRRCMVNPSGKSYCPVSSVCSQWAAIQENANERAT